LKFEFWRGDISIILLWDKSNKIKLSKSTFSNTEISVIKFPLKINVSKFFVILLCSNPFISFIWLFSKLNTFKLSSFNFSNELISFIWFSFKNNLSKNLRFSEFNLLKLDILIQI
jgi:hypothetical protein